MLLSIIFHKIYLEKLKNIFDLFSNSSKFIWKFNHFKNKHLSRIFQTLLKNKLKFSFDMIKKRKIVYLNFKNSIKRV
jgi:hypothetical protein